MREPRASTAYRDRNLRSSLLLSAMMVGAIWLVGCVTQSAKSIDQPPFGDRARVVQIQPCQDRTDFKGERNLPEEATKTLTEKLSGAKLFEITPGAPLTLTCDIERFAEGSPLKRWIAPGWGTTEAAVAVMVWEGPESKILATFRSRSSVSAGGLYTIGADQYILGVAFDEIVKQMREWVEGKPDGQPKTAQ